jgi:hypothetical protein
MTDSIRIILCECGAVPVYRSWRGGEDFMEGEFRCESCGANPQDPVEHVWGGQEMKELAAYAWNEWRQRAG